MENKLKQFGRRPETPLDILAMRVRTATRRVTSHSAKGAFGLSWYNRLIKASRKTPFDLCVSAQVQMINAARAKVGWDPLTSDERITVRDILLDRFLHTPFINRPALPN